MSDWDISLHTQNILIVIDSPSKCLQQNVCNVIVLSRTNLNSYFALCGLIDAQCHLKRTDGKVYEFSPTVTCVFFQKQI